MPPICVPRAPGQIDKGCLHPNTVALHSERTRAYNRLAFKEHPDEWTKAGAVASSYLADGSIVATRLGPNGWYWNTILCMKRWKGMLRTHSRSHARTHAHMQARARTHTRVYVYTHAHTCTHAHTRTRAWGHFSWAERTKIQTEMRRYYMYYGEGHIKLAVSRDLISWRPFDHNNSPRGRWQVCVWV